MVSLYEKKIKYYLEERCRSSTKSDDTVSYHADIDGGSNGQVRLTVELCNCYHIYLSFIADR